MAAWRDKSVVAKYEGVTATLFPLQNLSPLTHFFCVALTWIAESYAATGNFFLDLQAIIATQDVI